jgi:putative tryptophan/tyrosine transport system substrate-binding protein
MERISFVNTGNSFVNRRWVIGSIAYGGLVVPIGVLAQQGRVWRIGFFYFGSRQSALDTGRYNAFLQGMRELGYAEGKNLRLEEYFGEGKIERLPELTEELVRSKVDAVVATGSPTYSALRRAGTSIPTVVTVTADPVVEGLAASLARPGGNFTGLTDTAENLGPKQLELLMDMVPKLSRVGVLLNPVNVSHPGQMKRLMLAAQTVGVQVVSAEVGSVAEIEPGFAALARERASAVVLFGDTFFVQQLQQIAQAALRQRMASAYLTRGYAEVGGLLSYGADIVDNFRRAATYVDKILKGAKPGDLPFEQPSKYSLVVNLTTARALGLTVSQSVLLRADQIIQ